MKKCIDMIPLRALSLVALLFASGGASNAWASGPSVQLSTELGYPTALSGQRTHNYLKIGLTGVRLGGAARTPVNIALVIDRSGSMSGTKFAEAKRAAKLVVARLQPEDVVSIVTYDTSVQVPISATLARHKSVIYATIDQLRTGGNTALFAGVSQGALQVRKFKRPNYVNRVILLSDGLANVGPSSPGELQQLGQSLGAEGITVTTIGLGLGYNEDLMAQLARASDGNHAFVENAAELARIFEYELSDVFSVVAQDVKVKVQFTGGAMPVAVLGRKALVEGNTVTLNMNQVYAAQTKHVLIEMQNPPLQTGVIKQVANVEVVMHDMHSGNPANLSARAEVKGSKDAALVERSTNQQVMVAVVEAMAVEKSRVALRLRDEGKVEAAQEVLKKNVEYLRKNSVKLKSKRLKDLGARNKVDFDQLDDEDWGGTRKRMRKMQHEVQSQQSY